MVLVKISDDSIQQPFVEQILTGKKKYEYRSRQTHIRGRVYLYASRNKGRLIEGGYDLEVFSRGPDCRVGRNSRFQ